MTGPGDRTAEQRAYYSRTAEHYDAMHLRADDEHGIALAAFAGFARRFGVQSVLDVGAGTGRALAILANEMPGVRVLGVEPVEELRNRGLDKGISADLLIAGSGEALPFGDNAFDFVIATGVLHHVPEPALVVAEMVRVARRGIMISDSNKYGQGSRILRKAKSAIRSLGLWQQFIRLQTRGRMAKWSEGDGVFYSYSVLDDIEAVRAKFPRFHFVTTTALDGHDLRRDASHLCLIATVADLSN